MLTLDYTLDPLADSSAVGVDMALADSTALRYQLFPGDLTINSGGVDFSTHWGWVPVLDFALSLETVGKALEQQGEARFDFTESNDALNFRHEDGAVHVSATYAAGIIRVGLEEFSDEVHRFVRKVIRDLCEQHPRLAMNPKINRYLVG